MKCLFLRGHKLLSFYFNDMVSFIDNYNPDKVTKAQKQVIHVYLSSFSIR